MPVPRSPQSAPPPRPLILPSPTPIHPGAAPRPPCAQVRSPSLSAAPAGLTLLGRSSDSRCLLAALCCASNQEHRAWSDLCPKMGSHHGILCWRHSGYPQCRQPRAVTTRPSSRVVSVKIADVRRFSGIYARKGGLTTAISAGVTEEILFLRSGHSQSRAARAENIDTLDSTLYKSSQEMLHKRAIEERVRANLVKWNNAMMPQEY